MMTMSSEHRGPTYRRLRVDNIDPCDPALPCDPAKQRIVHELVITLLLAPHTRYPQPRKKGLDLLSTNRLSPFGAVSVNTTRSFTTTTPRVGGLVPPHRGAARVWFGDTGSRHRFPLCLFLPALRLCSLLSTVPVTGLSTIQQVSCLEALTRCPAPRGPGQCCFHGGRVVRASVAGAPTAGEPEASSRDAGPPPSRFRSLGSGRAQKLQVRGPRVFKSILLLLKEAKFQGAELDLLKMRLHPRGAPRGAGEPCFW